MWLSGCGLLHLIKNNNFEVRLKMNEEKRKCCEFCGEHLGHAAYYRHLHDVNGIICQGRMCPSESEKSDFSSSLEHESSFRDALENPDVSGRF